ncbi:hypothetical protein BX616_000263 [Lobosporangium transversale]|nr:hypothetical protein BX616_000263 [Lobosporangium transversale]
MASILENVNLVSVSVLENARIPLPNTLICSPLLNEVLVKLHSTGGTYPNGTVKPSTGRPAPPRVIASNPKVFTSQAIPTEPTHKENVTRSSLTDLNIALNEVIKRKGPGTAFGASMNTLTFDYSEHVLLNRTVTRPQYTLVQQHFQSVTFHDQQIIGITGVSPENFVITKYIDQPFYSWTDLVGAVGGMASIAFTGWVFLFGNGRYRSWGVMQQYVLRNSPKSSQYPKKAEESKGAYKTVNSFFKNQLSKIYGSAEDAGLDSVPLNESMTQNSRCVSQCHCTIINMNRVANTAVAVGNYSHGNSNSEIETKTSHLGFDDELDLPMRRYSMGSSGTVNDYLMENGVLRAQSLQPPAPISEGGDEAEARVSELIQLIDLRIGAHINERMWSLERILARYYLDGFSLRNHCHLNLIEGQESGKLAPKHAQWCIHPETEALPSSSSSSSSDRDGARSNQGLNPPYSPSSSPPGTCQSSQRNLVEPELPLHRDMRGTIRKAMERLQNEWPQYRAVVTVPGPHAPLPYQSNGISNGNNNSSNNNDDNNIG